MIKESTTFSGTDIDNTVKASPEKTYKYYQDTAFKLLFSEEKYQRLFLRDYCKEIDYKNADLKNIVLENMFTLDMYNDVCFRADETLIVLMEHQSRINQNMPLRMFLYAAEEYKRLLKNNDKWRLLRTKELIEIPRPEFYVVYTGNEQWGTEILKLSDSFPKGKQFLELLVPVYTKDNSKGIIKEYTEFINTAKGYKSKGMTLLDGIKEAICKYSNTGYEMADFLKRREDIMDIMEQQMTIEEVHAMDLEITAKEVAKEVTEKVTEEVTEEVTEKVTKEVTENSIRQVLNMFLKADISKKRAIQLISEEYGLTESEVLKILND